MNFDRAFKLLTGNPPFPWQRALYRRFVGEESGGIPQSCSLPTGLGKTSVVAIWLIALANRPDLIPRRLIYVVNRRTVVDQTTSEVEKYRTRLQTEAGLAPLCETLSKLCAFNLDDGESPLALSTLRGQFADNREWSADPARPAVIAGTVDMIGSRLLFSGYGIGFKSRPLHAGFLGGDSLLIHDEAHLEPAFQTLLESIHREQQKEASAIVRPLQVMELTATTRGRGGLDSPSPETPFGLSDDDQKNAVVKERIFAKKEIVLHETKDEKKLADRVVELARRDPAANRAVLIFVRKVEDVEKVIKGLPKDCCEQLTGTLRGRERDNMSDPTRPEGSSIFARFLPDDDKGTWKVEPKSGTVYLVCTSAGEVGVNISADDLVCDLSTFESMAQRFGRANRFGKADKTRIDVVHPDELDESDPYELSRSRTFELLRSLNGDGSPQALAGLDPDARAQAFAPPPQILPATDILFDAWALTSIKEKIPGRPPVEPYLHGVNERETPETYVAWREEVEWITGSLLDSYPPAELLADYPPKPHELLKDNANRVFDRLKKLKADDTVPIWILSDEGEVEVTDFGKLRDRRKEDLYFQTVLLPPSAGGLNKGLLTVTDEPATDVANELFLEGKQRRIRLWDDDDRLNQIRKTMSEIRTIDLQLNREDSPDESSTRRFWHWFERPEAADSDLSKVSHAPVAWQVHTNDVVSNSQKIAARLKLEQKFASALEFSAKCHDLGKRRVRWQRWIGNPNPADFWAKSGGKSKPLDVRESYRHEFGSLIDLFDYGQPYLEELRTFSPEVQELILHLVASHHGLGRPHLPVDYHVDSEPKGASISEVAHAIPPRFARLQSKFGRWGLAYLESLLRAADYYSSAHPSAYLENGNQ